MFSSVDDSHCIGATHSIWLWSLLFFVYIFCHLSPQQFSIIADYVWYQTGTLFHLHSLCSVECDVKNISGELIGVW